jgi:hypothetical protein
VPAVQLLHIQDPHPLVHQAALLLLLPPRLMLHQVQLVDGLQCPQVQQQLVLPLQQLLLKPLVMRLVQQRYAAAFVAGAVAGGAGGPVP